jgi:hypothetical protein
MISKKAMSATMRLVRAGKTISGVHKKRLQQNAARARRLKNRKNRK